MLPRQKRVWARSAVWHHRLLLPRHRPADSPVGACVYSVCGTAGIHVEGPFKKPLIFALAATVIAGGLMVLFPQVVTFLPNMML